MKKNYILLGILLSGAVSSFAQSRNLLNSTQEVVAEARGLIQPADNSNLISKDRIKTSENSSSAVYIESFENDSKWKIIDPAKLMTIGKIYNQYAIDGDYNLVSGYDKTGPRNAWAISPAVTLEKGKAYYLSLWCYVPGFNPNYDEFRIMAGNSDSVDDMTTVLFDYSGEHKYATRKWQKLQRVFIPDRSGEFYFGIHHCTSEKYVNVVGFDRFYIGYQPDTFVQVVPTPVPTPAGEQLDYMTYFDDVYYGYTEKAGKVVYGEKDSVFIQGIAAQMPYAWVYGIKKNNTIEIPTGQYLGKMQTMTGFADMYLFAGNEYVPNEKEPSKFTYTQMPVLNLRVDDKNNMTADDGIVLVQSASKNGNSFNGALNFKMRPFNEKPVVPSASAQRCKYLISYVSTKYDEKKVNYMTEVAFSGDTVFIRNASYYMEKIPESWIYGISDGKTITFPSKQYLGNYIGNAPFPTYFYGATVSDLNSNNEIICELKDNFKMTVNGDKFSSPEYYVMYLGGSVSEACHDLYLEKYVTKPAIPAAPLEVNYSKSPSPNFNFTYPVQDIDGDPILEDSLYYRVYLDDKPYTLVPENQGGKYKYLNKKLTEIPVNFTDDYDLFYSLTKSGCQIYIYEEFEKISFEMVYRAEGKVGVSPRAVWTTTGGFIGTEGNGEFSGLVQPEINKRVINSVTYNVYGQRVSPNEKGIVIKVDTFDDGTVSSRKILNR